MGGSNSNSIDAIIITAYRTPINGSAAESNGWDFRFYENWGHRKILIGAHGAWEGSGADGDISIGIGTLQHNIASNTNNLFFGRGAGYWSSTNASDATKSQIGFGFCVGR